MLAEGFLRVLRYREERKFASASKLQKLQTHPQCVDPFSCARFDSDSPEPPTDSSQEGSNQEEPASSQFQELMVVPHGSAGLSIPGCLPVFTLDPDLTALLDNCSLLEQYPDLQVADSGLISHNPPRAFTAQPALVCELSQQQQPHGEPVTSIPDQGYLAMASVNSLDLPGSGLEPMSNSVLNGLLDKQLEEVYMQHLTDNLARCNSHLGNSLLHGLVPPPQPSSQGPDSLEPSLEGPRNDSRKTISYLSTQNVVPCSSNFSSPVLRISEADSPHLQ